MNEYPELYNESYVLYDRVMNPLAAQLEQKVQRDRGTRRGRPSTSSSTFDQPSSSHLNDEMTMEMMKGPRVQALPIPPPLRNKNCLVKDRFANGAWSWDWNKPINRGRVLSELNTLRMDLNSISLSISMDSISHPFPRMENFWLPHRLNLSLRGLDIDSIMCPMCNNHVESNAHVFFSCNIARDVWSLVRGWCGSNFASLSSSEDWDAWYLSWSASKDRKIQAYLIFASSCWVLWCFRNKVTFHSQVTRKSDIFDNIRLFFFFLVNV
ncbi:RNA-directed DNA polymerase, eukaryota, reverse transcriptase zinc-binding domain protein [Tanacetum coccineum]|uniref:RNA-directed DNA polymerase, eukaryota, reverse transcriptase zinc-binding domain protein n=1 Tax=Tanacetum coccineum TaxID=301880 RepID=A0ABQ5D9A7_9ASTR